MNLIYIPTSGRADAQHTLACLPPALHPRTRLVVQAGQQGDYRRKDYPVRTLLLPFGIDRISTTRTWITNHAMQYSRQGFYVLDDDIRFARRVSTDPSMVKLHRLEPADPELADMFEMLDSWLGQRGLGIVGISPRHGNHFVRDTTIKYNSRVSQFLGYRTDIAARVQWGRVQLYTEHDPTLQILALGYASKVSFEWAYEAVGDYGAPGGCSKWRTAAIESEAAQEMYRLHKDYAAIDLIDDRRYPKVQVYQTKFRWKKAYLSGLPEELQ